MSVYNEAPFVEEAVRSLLNIADMGLVLDGATTEYSYRGASTDGTPDIVGRLRAQGLPVQLITVADVDECSKRTAYLVANPGDWYFVLDGDELVTDVAKLRLFLKDTDADVVRISLNRWDGLSYMVPRVFRHRNGLRYGSHHSYIVDADGFCYLSHNEELDHPYGKVVDYPDCRIEHRHHLRDEARKLAKGEYHRKLQEMPR